MEMVTDKLYCVNLLAKLQDWWLICDIICCPNLTVNGGTHILHNFITCKCIISQKPKSFINWKQVFHDYFLAWFIYDSNVL